MDLPSSSTCLGALLGLLCWAGAGQAQTVEDRARTVTVLGIASGTTAPAGTLFGSISGNTRRDGIFNELDGSAEIGLGFGSAETALGFQASLVSTSLTNSPGDSGYVSLKASRRVIELPMPVYLGLTVDNIAPWGDASGLDPALTLAATTFGVATFGTPQQYPYMLTLGYGSDVGGFLEQEGLILGAGIGLSRNVGLTASLAGEAVTLGVALRIDEMEDVALGIAVNDVFDAENSRRLTVSLSFALDGLFKG